ncbi:uncharacterized protein FOBCDRAFT_268510 [Fusarium oxysporum Fo47]|uniref:uncharacterized protein n=1 Tax=Fusarium oxysporum Fo47 TaxID=660027 RepID=UPI002869A788|nr:uncharacterized protein FOBCDRAFT_268510 [Fusarium oxysporum Fo47]QKD48703.2 hypothetical protein FOBCDRAFT_268510 [Fusarium oxysporum Fo47]
MEFNTSSLKARASANVEYAAHNYKVQSQEVAATESSLDIAKLQALASPQFVPAGTSSILYEGTKFVFSRKSLPAPQGQSLPRNNERLEIIANCRMHKLFERLLWDIRRENYERRQGETMLFHPNNDGEWRYFGLKPKRDISTVVLEEAKKKSILDDARSYLSSRSCLNDSNIGEEAFAFLLSRGALPSQCLVLLEDVDLAGLQQNSNDTNQGLSLSSVLSAIDGPHGQEGRLLIMTKNHIDNVAEALKRPGRAD